MLPTSLKIEIIDHDKQRYPTCGDWQIDADGVLTISVSRTPNPAHHWLVAVHEVVEALACCYAGITPKQVDAFDLAFEDSELFEPGDSTDAPYHKQHVLAEIVERTLAFFLGIEWFEYIATIAELFDEKE